MGYSRIYQYGDITEVYTYEKDIVHNRPKMPNALHRKRHAEIRRNSIENGTYKRKKSSIARAIASFFRLCHHNNCTAKSITFATFTFAYEPTPKEAHRDIAHTMERYKKSYPAVPIRYISVFERTKKGRIHAHVLLYDLPPERVVEERKTRNFQRFFRKGYVDLRLAQYNSPKIASYMAKYMRKSFENYDDASSRTYTCSRNINKPTSYGSNTLTQYHTLILPEQVDVIESAEYDTQYLGKCYKVKYKK